jgi:hypothetical protein
MNASTLKFSVAALLVPTLLAQEKLRSRLKPITAPMRHAGVYHVGTGTWTRNGTLVNLVGSDVIYNNTCNSGGYFAFMLTGEKFQHRSAIPSPTHPYVQTVVPVGTGFDQAPGCSSSYVVDGFQFAYCSSATTTVDWILEYADFYGLCGAGEMVPTQSFHLTGMPGGTPTGGQRCWIIDVGLGAGGMSFLAQADRDGTFTGTPNQNQFGWSWGVTNTIQVHDRTGPVIAGDFTWAGGGHTGSLTPCKGVDGTIWDCPVNLAEAGTGMASNNFFRLVAPNCDPQGCSCYYFGGNPHADFWLKLYANTGCPPPTQATSFCDPGQGGVIPCPCGNPAASSGRGCENSSGTGGAQLSSCGVASLAQDTLGLLTTGQRPSATSVVLQGRNALVSGVVYGQGVRCISDHLLRLYVKAASNGSVAAPVLGDASVSSRSAALGDPIPSGGTRHYMVYYRDPNVLGGCPATSTFNATQALGLTWTP